MRKPCTECLACLGLLETHSGEKILKLQDAPHLDYEGVLLTKLQRIDLPATFSPSVGLIKILQARSGHS